MKKSAFVFLRATFFRWAKCIETVCSALNDAPQVLSVGDTHIENFGTWRDAEGRLVWGINDFDEAAIIAYPFDLVRLTASIRLSPETGIGNREAANAILAGYREGLANPRPVLLDEQETWMRPYAACTDKDRGKFWVEVDGYPDATPPPIVARNLKNSLPQDASVLRFASRVKGGGSLGRPRYVGIGLWRSGRVVREAKALVPSAWDWAHGNATASSRFLGLSTGRFRSFDPFLEVRDDFVLRRIAADSRKVDLGGDAGSALDMRLLKAMGFDIAAIHATEHSARQRINDDLDRRAPEWLHDAAKSASAFVETDFAEWSR